MTVLSEIAPFGYRRTLFSVCTVRPKFVLLVLLIAAYCLDAQQSQFRSAFNEFVHADGTIGASFAMLDQGRVADSGVWGMADKDLKQLVDNATIFHWGSITKTLTAVAIMQLRDRGKLSLDDPVVKYVPELMRFIARTIPSPALRCASLRLTFQAFRHLRGPIAKGNHGSHSNRQSGRSSWP
jgi:CubicO group peptidase (beta-lactamase class C family)